MSEVDFVNQYENSCSDYIWSLKNVQDPRRGWAYRVLNRYLGDNLQGKVVMDAGCGDGHEAPTFLNRGASEVLAFDSSPAMLEKAQQNVSGKPIVIKEGKFEAIPFPDASTDIVVGLFSLHYVADLDQAYTEMVRVIKPGGRMIFVCTHPEDMTRHKANSLKGQEIVTLKIRKGTVTVYQPSHTLAEYFSPYFLSHFTLENLDEFFPSNEKGEELSNAELLAFTAIRKMTSD